MSSNGGGLTSEEESNAGSVCLTEDLAYDDAATRFSGDHKVEGEEAGQKDSCVDNDVDALLQDYWIEQESRAPAPGTSKETCEKKCQNWLDTSAGKASSEVATKESTSNESQQNTARPPVGLPPEAEIPIEKMAVLLKDHLEGVKTYQTYGSDCEGDKQRTVPLAPISQLASDISLNLPEALMSIIAYVGPGRTDDQDASAYSSQIQTFLVEVLRHYLLIGTDAEPQNQKELEEPDKLQYKSFTEESMDQYFCAFHILLRPTRLNKSICEEVERYVNKQIESSKTLKTPWICISNTAIYDIIVNTNQEKVLFLAPEKVAKCANRLQIYVWDNILNRCLTLLMSLGFNLRQGRLKEDDNGGASVDTFSLSQDSQGSEPEPDLPLGQQEVAVAAIGNDSVSLQQVQLVDLLDHVEQNEEDLNDSQSSINSQGDSELEFEFLRDSQSSSNSYSYSISPTAFLQHSLMPRRSPDEVLSPSPRLAQLSGYANEAWLGFRNFGNTSSQGSSSNDSGGPTPKFPRLM